MRILLIEDDPEDAERLRGLLSDAESSVQVVLAESLELGLEQAANRRFDVLLLDISLPDRDGLSAFLEAAAALPSVPIVILSRLANTELAQAAVRLGAEDYLVKDQLDGENLIRALRYSKERRRIRSQVQQAKREMEALSLTDELTGLLNWRGFVTLAEQELKRADRDRCAVVVIVLAVGGVRPERPNEADPIKEAGLLISATFRDCDVKARIGGGAFAVLAWSPVGIDIDAMTGRLHRAVHKRNLFAEDKIDLSAGCAVRLPGSGEILDELVARAGSLQQSGAAADTPTVRRFEGIEGPRP